MKKIFIVLFFVIIASIASTTTEAMKIELNKNIFLPGEELLIKGTTESDGIIKLFLANIFDATIETKARQFSYSFYLPKNIKAGIYTLYIIFENSKKEIETKNFEIKAIPTLLEIATNKEKFLPKENVTIRATLYDHNYEILPAIINLKINGIEKKLRSGEIFYYQLQSNSSLGDMKIEASSKGLSAERYINIGENEEISIELEKNKLKIRNIGNVPYEKTLEIKFFGQKNFSKNIFLKLGLNEEATFELNAPEGQYKIFVEEKNFTARLTGKAVIEKIKKPSIFSQHPLLAFFFFIVLILILIWFFHKLTRIFFVKTKMQY